MSDAELAFAKDKLHTEATVDLHQIQQERELTYQLATLEYANKHQITIDQVKAMLASTAMKLNVEKELNAANNAARTGQTPRGGRGQKPPVQAPGRAANGKAFSQATQ